MWYVIAPLEGNITIDTVLSSFVLHFQIKGKKCNMKIHNACTFGNFWIIEQDCKSTFTKLPGSLNMCHLKAQCVMKPDIF